MGKIEVSEQMVYRLLSEIVAELKYLFDPSPLTKLRAVRRLSEKFNILRGYADAIREMNQNHLENLYGPSQTTQAEPPDLPDGVENQPPPVPPPEAPRQELPGQGETPGQPEQPLKTFTLTDLARYNGRDGMPAYVAYSGMVYDATNIPRWLFGQHFGLMAGRDLTIQYDTCHVGRPTLNRLPIVGILLPDV